MNVRKLIMCAAVTAAGSLACDGNRGSGPVVGPQLNWGPGSNTLYEPPAWEKGGIVGDWFPCRDESCSRLDNQGIRFTEDGEIIQLIASGNLDPGERYCEGELMGMYEVSGDRLTITIAGQGGFAPEIEFRFTLEEDRITLESDEIETQIALRIDPPRSDGPCQRDFENIPTPAPSPAPVPGGG